MITIIPGRAGEQYPAIERGGRAYEVALKIFEAAQMPTESARVRHFRNMTECRFSRLPIIRPNAAGHCGQKRPLRLASYTASPRVLGLGMLSGGDQPRHGMVGRVGLALSPGEPKDIGLSRGWLCGPGRSSLGCFQIFPLVFQCQGGSPQHCRRPGCQCRTGPSCNLF